MELARPGNVTMAGVGVVIGALVAGLTMPTYPLAWGALATMFVVAGGNALNDVGDVELDRKAHPGRPLPSGRLTVRSALFFGIGTFGLAIAFGALVSMWMLLLVVMAEAGLVAYEMHLKASGLIGNIVVGGLVAATFVAGALTVGRVPAAVGFLAGLALLANVAREVWKDAEDATHDEGRQTMARRWGEYTARRVAQGCTLGAVALSPVPYLYGFGGTTYLAIVAAADVIFLAAVLNRRPGSAQRLSKLAMAVALVAFAAGALVGGGAS